MCNSLAIPWIFAFPTLTRSRKARKKRHISGITTWRSSFLNNLLSISVSTDDIETTASTGTISGKLALVSLSFGGDIGELGEDIAISKFEPDIKTGIV